MNKSITLIQLAALKVSLAALCQQIEAIEQSLVVDTPHQKLPEIPAPDPEYIAYRQRIPKESVDIVGSEPVDPALAAELLPPSGQCIEPELGGPVQESEGEDEILP